MAALRHLLVGTVAVLALAASPTVFARGQLQTRQTGVDIPAGDRAGRLVLANTGDAPVAAQIRVYAWTQDGGTEDLLEPSTALVASPPIVEIPAGSEQLIRLVRPTSTAPQREQAYRVVVDELPAPGDAEQGAAITVRMRYLIPAFVRAADPAPAKVDCRIEPAAEPTATTMLACRNSGGRAAQLGATTLVDSAGQSLQITPGLLGYVLAGSARRWPLEADALASLGTPSKLKVRLNGQPVVVELGAGR